jgi:hypothetical protein
MKRLARTARVAACSALVLGAVGLAAAPASASTGNVQARDVPAATAGPYFFYTIKTTASSTNGCRRGVPPVPERILPATWFGGMS